MAAVRGQRVTSLSSQHGPKLRSRKHGAAVPLDERDKRLLNLMQGRFPIAPRPYAHVAAEAGTSEQQAIERVRLFTGMHRFLPTLVRLQGYKVVEMPVNHRSRKFGVSKYGAMNRAMRGLVDCFAVRWMRKRMLNYKVTEES